MFEEHYFNSVNYTDYLSRGDRYVQLANEVIGLTDSLGLPRDSVLDFGCAVGHLLGGLKSKVFDLYGCDISVWAREQAWAKGYLVADSPEYDKKHDIVFSLDVFEHMEEEELTHFFDNIDTKVVIFRIPVCAQDNEDYVLEVSRKDPTHKIRWTKDRWRSQFISWGFKPLDLNLHTIYNSEGVYSGIAINYDKLLDK